MKLDEVRTPAFVVDASKVKANCEAMRRRAEGLGVALRPHVKTHKCLPIGKWQVGDGEAAITVSTLAEARHFREGGFRDMTYAFPITPDKLGEAAELTRSLDRFTLILDHPDTVDAVRDAGRREGLVFSVLLKVDPGYHRAGVDPRGGDAVRLAQTMHEAKEIEFLGLLTHGGHSYHARDPDAIRAVAREERDALVELAGLLEREGIPCPVKSAGSTPTACLGEDWTGVDEIRPGNYVFYDRFQAALGVCGIEDCAATVLCTVAGHYPSRNRILMDAGALALSKDLGAEHLGGPIDYGALAGHPEVRVVSLSQEHGILGGEAPPALRGVPHREPREDHPQPLLLGRGALSRVPARGGQRGDRDAATVPGVVKNSVRHHFSKRKMVSDTIFHGR